MSSLCFFNLSLLHVESRQAYPLVSEQILQETQESKLKTKKKKSGKGKRGRPLGSKNKNRTEVELSVFLLQLQGCIRQVLSLVGCHLALTYFVSIPSPKIINYWHEFSRFLRLGISHHSLKIPLTLCPVI